jgi:anaerobic magnesium-protoporphyrin IX monomethyl ester cyclase
MKKHKVVLYNPKSVFYTMPLALVAVASYLDPEKFEVLIIDGRLEKDALKKVLDETRDAICFGTTVLTGAPIHDALVITGKVKKSNPQLTTVWGGWHPSLFPEETLEEKSIDVVVAGQGEITFAELLETLVAQKSFQGIPGLYFKESGRVIQNPARHMENINQFPPFNYELIDVQKYFDLKGRKQFDYISSQGCRFRCTFCADPMMYKRGWHGLDAERLGAELEQWWNAYRFDDLNFQDETFFTYSQRVSEIAEEFIKRKFSFTWFGTMRADQGYRLDEEILVLCKRSGLRKVMIGVEAGSQQMLDWMKKDITIEQVFYCAELCRRHDIAITFNVIVGFPGESEQSIAESIRVTKELRKMSPYFDVISNLIREMKSPIS